MRVALAQIDVKVGQIQKNLNTIKVLIEKYDSEEYDIIAFPELCIGGYLVGDLWNDPDWIDELKNANKELQSFLVEKNIKTIVAYGNIHTPGGTGEDGRQRLFNSAWILQNKNNVVMASSVSKTLLPTYRFFDDKRYFSSEKSFEVFNLITPYSNEYIDCGFEICEDLWHKDYPVNPIIELVSLGAKYIFNLSASPYSFNKYKARNNIIKKTLSNLTENYSLKNFFYVNNVGAQNNGKNIVTFDGDSCVYNAMGEICTPSIYPFSEGEIRFDTKAKELAYKRIPIEKEKYQFLASLVGIRAMDDIQGRPVKYVIGVSGGIDSAVVLCLLCLAVGKNRVTALNLPSKYNTEKIKNIAYKLCENIEIPLKTIPIESLVTSQVKTFKKAGFNLSITNIENIQAKIRGTSILSNIAGITDSVMTNNGNKVEIALGYATLYGDINGAIAPLGDLLKVEVWALARFLNKEIYKKEVIPQEIIADIDLSIKIQPSAELKEKQVDPMKWGYHDALLAYLINYKKGSLKKIIQLYDTNIDKLFELLSFYIDKDASFMKSLFEKYHLFNRQLFISDLKWFINLLDLSVFKRVQSPPIIVQSKSAFGYDHRESQIKRTRNIL